MKTLIVLFILGADALHLDYWQMGELIVGGTCINLFIDAFTKRMTSREMR